MALVREQSALPRKEKASAFWKERVRRNLSLNALQG